MVTGARLFTIPCVAALAYSGHLWSALLLGIVIGCTDFVDGYLARKYGPSVLGGMMDPIADKVFIAFTYLPLVDMGLFPGAIVMLLFIRELTVNGLRAGLSRRGIELESTYLGKVKTWTQMQGMGTVVLFALLWEQKWILHIGIGAMALLPLVFMAIVWRIKGELWTGALVMAAWAPVALFLIEYSNARFAVTGGITLVVLLTLYTGAQYYDRAKLRLADHGGFDRVDFVRLLTAVLLPATIYPSMEFTTLSGWFPITILGLELAAGGLDDLQSRHGQASGAAAWLARLGLTSALLGATHIAESPTQVMALGTLALLWTAGSVAYQFWRSRELYVGVPAVISE